MPVMTKAKPRSTTGKSAVKKIVKAITGKSSGKTAPAASGKNVKRVYFFGNGKAEGGADMKVALYDEDEFKFQTIGGAFVSFHPGDERNGDGLSAALLPS